MHFLSEEDFVDGLRMLCEGDAAQKDVFMFHLIDEDASGYIGFGQFREFLTDFFDSGRRVYERNPDGVELGHPPSVFDSLCTLLPTGACTINRPLITMHD